MLKRHFISTSALSFAAQTDAVAAKAIEKVVYMSADESLKSVVLHCGNAADATLRLIAAMVVHLTIRTYHHNDAERRDYKDTKEEILSAFKTYAELKRGQPFRNAWVSRLLKTSTDMARSLVKDYDKKGVQDGSPLSFVLRAKTPDKANDIVFEFIMGKTKGANGFVTLEKALAPVTKTKQPVAKGKGSNAVKASTDQPNRIAKAIESDKGAEIINAIAGNSKSKAVKLADKVGQSNVDHLTFVMRSVGYLNFATDCLAVSNRALERMKEIEAAAIKTPVVGEKEHKGEPAADKQAATG